MKKLTAMIGDALADANDDRAVAADLLDERVEALAQGGDAEAEAASVRARLKGWRTTIDDYCRSVVGRLVTTFAKKNGKAAAHSESIPAGKSAHRRAVTGEVAQLYLPMVDLLFEELRGKLQECGRQGDKLLKTVAVIQRLLRLQDEVPQASTPHQALTHLGLSLEEWLAR